MLLRHDSGGPAELRNSQVLGDDSPLEFDEDGYAEIDDAAGEKLLAMHRHVERGGHGPATPDGDATDDVDESAGAEDDGSGPDYTSIPPNLEDATYDELMEIARDHDISGRSSMDKADLIDALRER